MGDITQMLTDARSGDSGAQEALFTRVYAELQRLARSKLSAESTLAHLDAGSLVHEAYLRLADGAALPDGDRRSFFAYAAKIMRSVIVDYVRTRNAAKRGSGISPVTLVTHDGGAPAAGPEIEALDHAMNDLERVDARCHRVVELRYFAGMSVEEIAQVLELSPATVKRDWQRARAFLYRALQHE